MSENLELEETRTALVHHTKSATRGQITALVALLPLIGSMFALMNGVQAGPVLPALSLVSLVVMLRGLSSAMRSHEEAKQLSKHLAKLQRTANS